MHRPKSRYVFVLHGARADRPEVRHLVSWVRDKGAEVIPRVTWEPGDATRFADYRLAVTTNVGDADVIVRFRFAPPLVDLRGCEPPGGGAGRTAFCADSNPAPVLPLLSTGGGQVKMDVYVDPEGRSAEQLAPFGLTPQTYFQALVTHELGHVLGIGGHSDDVRDVMNTFPRVTAPSDRDERTVRWVWLQPAGLLL